MYSCFIPIYEVLHVQLFYSFVRGVTCTMKNHLKISSRKVKTSSQESLDLKMLPYIVISKTVPCQKRENEVLWEKG